MGRYVTRRLLQALPLLFLLSIFMFTLIHLLPGGPEEVLYNPNLDEAGRQALRASLGLDDPIPIQYLKWLVSALHGNFGYSFFTNQTVSSVILDHFPSTLELFSLALLLALIIAITLGTLSATRQGKLTDYLVTTLTYVGISLPIFLLGLLMQEVFSRWLGWLPPSGSTTAGYTYDFFNGLLDHLIHLILPMTVLALTFTARWSRYMRSSMLEVTRQDYIRTARAKGLPPIPLLRRHALRNAVIPLITVVAIDFGSVAGGAAITESVFAWPGMGRLFLDSAEHRDYPVLLAILILSAVFVVLFNLLADILYAVMDPRIRYA
ncbi:ABC transporter permease [Ktedonobacter racemifer]|uniref:Binding-protein-dependent transport systems inner membrane component n=1 Tax=Ktedonobacter racemifer DSM 44963 TaxID=485913 RepID=D6TK10_KTERA|nr:ABC transporter permease [Ktedonobacter racemifer]EFH89767.1 binding-protein-dependent transport systems inner membrane component [Ktedonobacter racemifer DSM 44963]